MNRAISLGYHDVLDANSCSDGGLRGHAVHYALDRRTFREHLAGFNSPSTASLVRLAGEVPLGPGAVPILLPFDDGAIGAYSSIADDLEEYGWRGHFFIVSSWIGRRGFVNASHIRELRRRGHVIGSHSATHPERMPSLGFDRVLEEWLESGRRLSDVLGEAVSVASVPNGYYSRSIGAAAAAAGIKILFNSEPTTAIHSLAGCRIFGRYAITSRDSPEIVTSLVQDRWPKLRQRVLWDTKKLVKAVSGPAYLALRTRLLARSAKDSVG